MDKDKAEAFYNRFSALSIESKKNKVKCYEILKFKEDKLHGEVFKTNLFDLSCTKGNEEEANNVWFYLFIQFLTLCEDFDISSNWEICW